MNIRVFLVLINAQLVNIRRLLRHFCSMSWPLICVKVQKIYDKSSLRLILRLPFNFDINCRSVNNENAGKQQLVKYYQRNIYCQRIIIN